MKTGCFNVIVTAAVILAPLASDAVPPRYDHVVIVVEENHTLAEIIGDTADAPYITQLAASGVSFNNMFSLTHPSQPNYLHLFSGSAQGVVNDGLVSGYPFTSANLGASLLARGLTFRGYSEGLRAVGDADWDPRTTTDPGVDYRRKHNPWANWQGSGTNQLPAVTNNLFSNFPNDFTQLPTISFVIPDQQHDMHNGSRRMGDDWLRENLFAYAQWAPTHNSLLIITWDEDDYDLVNRIPTVFFGANLKNGTTSAPTWTLHNLLRTLEDMYGLAHAGRAALVPPITGVFTGEPAPIVATFRQGLSAYSGCHDTFITSDQPGVTFGTAQNISVDGDSGAATGLQAAQALVRFDNLFGPTSDRIPTNAVIVSAKLILWTGAGADDDTKDLISVHRMQIDWSDDSTWNSLNAGVAFDEVEARAAATFTHYPNVGDIPAIFDVTADVNAWRLGAPNRGWVLNPDSGGSDGWIFKSSETTSDASLRPTLEIAYTLPATTFDAWASQNGLVGEAANPTADPEGDRVINLLEFAFNTNPLQSDPSFVPGIGTAGLPIVRNIGPGDAGRLQLEFVRRKISSGSQISYEPQFSADLLTWITATSMDSVSSIDATWERVLVSDPVASAPARFARVRIVVSAQTSPASVRMRPTRSTRVRMP